MKRAERAQEPTTSPQDDDRTDARADLGYGAPLSTAERARPSRRRPPRVTLAEWREGTEGVERDRTGEWLAGVVSRAEPGGEPAPGWEERIEERWRAGSGWNPDRTADDVVRNLDGSSAEVVLHLWALEEGGERDLGGEG